MKFRFLIIEKHFVWVSYIKKSPVPINLCLSIPRKMSPYTLIFRTQNNLLNGKALNLRMNNKRSHEYDKSEHK